MHDNHGHPYSPQPTGIAWWLSEADGHIHAGRLAAAASIYERVLHHLPDDPDVHHTLGLVYLEQGCLEPALFHIGRSIELNASKAVVYRSMGDALRAAGQLPLAIRAYEKARALSPDYNDALLNLGIAFHELGMNARAEEAFQKILLLAPDHIQALNNLGKVNHDGGRPDLAMRYYDRCIDLQPDYAEARFNRAALLLALEDYEKGWREYEWRFRRTCTANVYPHRLRTRRWQGEDFGGRRLLVHCEQGMGDVLQFFRFLPMVKHRGGTVILEAHEPLLPLLKTQAGIDEIVGFDPKIPPTVRHDLHIPLLSLPGIFHTGADSIPNILSYIEVHGGRDCPWPSNLKKGRTNIGLVWAASALDPRRNLPIEKCGAWFKDPRLHFVSLQVGEPTGRIQGLKNAASPITILGADLRNFLDTAHAMAELDLVISVDTAAAHLAGAMGKPLWILLPYTADWRWPLKRKNCPWYPRAELFRQARQGDWDEVIAQVALALGRLTSGALPGPAP